MTVRQIKELELEDVNPNPEEQKASIYEQMKSPLPRPKPNASGADEADLNVTDFDEDNSMTVLTALMKGTSSPTADQIIRPESAKSEKPASVLIVDDQHFNLYAFQCMLEQENVTVDTSLSGINAISLIKARLQNRQPLYNCIFLDYSMPEKDGPQTAFDIRSLCEESGV